MAKAAAAATAKLLSLNAVKCAALGIIGMAGVLISAVGPIKLPFAETLAKTYYRQAVTGLLLMALAIAGLITAVVNLFDPNQFKDQIVRYVHERTQRDLVLDGELTMHYFPKLGIESGKASLSQRRSAREFASIDKARVHIAWLPLLRGRMHVDRFEVDGLRAQLVRFKDGTTNVDDLLHDLSTIAPEHVELDGAQLHRAALQWTDELAWQRGSLHDLEIEIGRIADSMASPLTASARIDAPAAGVDARLRLKGRLLFDAQAGRVELARIEGQLDGQALGIDNLALQIKGDLSALPRERTIAADNLLLSAMHKSGLSVYQTVLSAPEVKWGEYKLSGTSLSVEASVSHPARSGALSVKVPRFEWAERALRDTVAQAQLTLQRDGATVHAQGSGSLALVLDGGPRLELAALDATATVAHPALATAMAAQLKGQVDINLAQHSAQAVLAGQLAGADVKAELGVVDYGARAQWTLDVEQAKLDADALLAPAWLARWHDDAMPFDAAVLRDANLRGRWRVTQLKAAGLQFDAVSTRFDLDKSVLQLDPIAAQVYGAQLEAVLRIDAAGAVPRVVAKGSLNEAELRPLLADAAQASWLDGRGALTWDLLAEGASVGTLRQALAGSLNVTLRSGALSGIDLRAALLEGRGELGKRAPAQQRDLNATASTPFNEIKGRIELRERRATARALELTAAALRATGEGELLLDSGVVDLRLQASVGRGAHELASLAGISVPMHVQGPWRQPRLAFDFGAATGVNAAHASEATGEPALALVKTSASSSGERAAASPK